MSKKLSISQEERNRILNLHENFKRTGVLSEQDDGPHHSFVRGVQRFLNEKIKAGLTVDGLTDNNMKSKTAQAIGKYQQNLGVYPVDGVWGPETWSKMTKEDKERLKDLVAEEGGLIDRFLRWIGL